MTALDALVLTVVSPFVALFLYTAVRVWRVRFLRWRYFRLLDRASDITHRMLRAGAPDDQLEEALRALGRSNRAHDRYVQAARDLGVQP